MKKAIYSMVILACLMGSAALASECVIPKLDLDKVPFPIKTANTKFDLAEGETYVLNGTVVKKDGLFFFQIDFDSQPWLATQYRLQNPYFGINASDVEMIGKVGTGELVQMAVVVRKVTSETSIVTYEKTDGITVLAPPERIKRMN